MSREFSILEEEDFDKFVILTKRYFHNQKQSGKKFQKLKVIQKRYVKSKTPAQHKLYFACINQLKKALEEKGTRCTQEDLHYIMKKKAGFTKMVEMPDGKMEMVVKSISDTSDDINGEKISQLIAFIIEYAAINLGYVISIDSNGIA